MRAHWNDFHGYLVDPVENGLGKSLIHEMKLLQSKDAIGVGDMLFGIVGGLQETTPNFLFPTNWH